MKATIKNDFHNTESTVIINKSGVLSERQVRRVRDELCGYDACTCGGNLSEHGPQDVSIETVGMYQYWPMVKITKI